MDYWWHLLATVLIPIVVVWGCGLVTAAWYYGGSPAPYLRWTAGLFGRGMAGLFRVAGNILGWFFNQGRYFFGGILRRLLQICTTVAVYLWRHWRREIIWFVLGAATTSLAFWRFGTP